MTGTVLIPSLNRAHLVEEFFKAYRETDSTVHGLVLVDKTDPKLEEYRKIEYPFGWKLIITEAITMGSKVREVYEQYKDLDYVMILNDDHRPRTKHWDEAIISQINGHNVVSTNDGPTPDKPWNAPKRICGAICFSGQIVRTLGWIFPPGLEHMYSDDVWGLLFSKAQCAHVMMDVCIEHVHAFLHPELRDETYKKINGDAVFSSPEPTGGLWDADRVAFQRWLKEDGDRDVQKIIALQPKTGMMIATPSHDGNCSVVYALGLTDFSIFLASQNIYFEMSRVIGSSLIPHARNSLADMFLKSKCQKLLFVDADQGWDRNAGIALFQSSRRIIAGITPHKRFPMNLNFDPLDKHKHYFKDLNNKSIEEFVKYANENAEPNGDIEVEHTGTGFLCIDRSVFDLMKDQVHQYYPFDNNNSVKHYEFFKMGYEAESERFRGEDWFFVRLAKKLKIPIYINARALVSHFGSHLYSVN